MDTLNKNDNAIEERMSANSSDMNQKPFDIIIVGETNLDLILHGLPEDMPVERELLANGFDVTLGGSSSILAHNLALLGTRVGFVSEVGSVRWVTMHLERSRKVTSTRVASTSLASGISPEPQLG